jgi:hypothetical protein
MSVGEYIYKNLEQITRHKAYNSAKSLSSITCKPRMLKIRDSILSVDKAEEFGLS